MTPDHPVQAWHALVADRSIEGLDALLADDVVFHSPIVHTPQQGRAVTKLYLSAAFQVLFNESFTYVREVASGDSAALEFTSEIDGVVLNGIDLIRFDAEGRIVDFKVMIRPLKAIQLVHGLMARMLESLKPS